MVIGLTGPVAAGKTLAASILQKKGFRVIRVDRIGHEVLKMPGKAEKIGRIFGPEILDRNGRVSREKLGDTVFGIPGELRRLNRIVHPLMRRMVKKQVRESGARPVAIDAALLFEMGLFRLCDTVIMVDAPFAELAKRAEKARGMDADRIRTILAAQMSARNKRVLADHVIVNNSTKKKFEKQLLEILEGLN